MYWGLRWRWCGECYWNVITVGGVGITGNGKCVLAFVCASRIYAHVHVCVNSQNKALWPTMETRDLLPFLIYIYIMLYFCMCSSPLIPCKQLEGTWVDGCVCVVLSVCVGVDVDMLSSCSHGSPPGTLVKFRWSGFWMANRVWFCGDGYWGYWLTAMDGMIDWCIFWAAVSAIPMPLVLFL